jgi:hypothetical protein
MTTDFSTVTLFPGDHWLYLALSWKIIWILELLHLNENMEYYKNKMFIEHLDKIRVGKIDNYTFNKNRHKPQIHSIPFKIHPNNNICKLLSQHNKTKSCSLVLNCYHELTEHLYSRRWKCPPPSWRWASTRNSVTSRCIFDLLGHFAVRYALLNASCTAADDFNAK